MAKHDFSPHGCKCGLMREEDCTCKEKVDTGSSDLRITAAKARMIANNSIYDKLMENIWSVIRSNAEAGLVEVIIHPSIIPAVPPYQALTPLQQRVIEGLREAGFDVEIVKHDCPEYGETYNAFKVVW